MRLQLEPSLDPATYAFGHTMRVRFAETDAMGLVHHGSYLLYMESARVEYLRHVGHPYKEVRAGGIDLTVLEAFVRYRRPLYFDDQVTVRLARGAVTRTTFQLGYLLTVDDDVRATGVTVHGCVTQDGRAARLPEWLRTM